MKNKTFRLLIAVTALVTLLSLFHLISLTIQSVYMTGWIDEEFAAMWNEKILWMQILFFGGRLLGGYLFYILLIMFLMKTVIHYKKGIIFPKANVAVLYGCSVSFFLYSFCNLNIDILGATNEFLLKIDTEHVVLTLLFVIFAMMYHLAVKISEENKLTI